MQTHPVEIEVSAKAVSAWCPGARDLFVVSSNPLIELALPEYEAAGLGKALCRVKPFRIKGNQEVSGVFARSVCADTSRLFVVTEDMGPTVLGQTHDEIQARAPQETLRYLFDLGFPIDLVTLGATRADQFDDLGHLADFVRLYHRRSSWLEGHPLDVAIATMEFRLGANLVFDGSRLFCQGV